MAVTAFPNTTVFEDNAMVTTDDFLTEDDPSSFLTPESYERFAFISQIIVTPIICTLGIIFSALGLGVIWPDVKQQRMSIDTYLCALTISDIIYLAIGLVRTIPTILKNLHVENSGFVEEHMKRWMIYFDMVFSHTSLAMILVMSFERMMALVRPLQVRRTWFAKYPLRIVGSCVLINVVFLLPFIVYMEVGSRSSNNETIYFVQFKPAVKADMDRYMIAQTIIDYIIPAICLLIMNITIPIKYYKVAKLRKTTFNETTGSFTSRQMKITSTVLAVTVMYFLLSLPNLTVKILGFVDTDYSFDGKHKLVFWFAIDLSNLITYINAANDCVIYILVSDYYRSVFKKKYCKCCQPETNYCEDNPDTYSKMYSNSFTF